MVGGKLPHGREPFSATLHGTLDALFPAVGVARPACAVVLGNHHPAREPRATQGTVVVRYLTVLHSEVVLY